MATGVQRQPLRLRVPYQDNARAVLRFAVGLVVAAGFASLLGETGLVIAAIVATVAGMLLVAGWVMWSLSRAWMKQIHRIEAGSYHLRWPLAAADWASHRAGVVRTSRRLVWGMPLFLGAAGLLTALLQHMSGEQVGGSIFSTYAIMLGSTMGAGLAIGLGVRWLGLASERIMRSNPGECVVGAEGLYVTGHYWPWRTTGRVLTDVVLENGARLELRFIFRITAGKGSSDHIVRIPVPPGEEAAAAQLIDRMRKQRSTPKATPASGPDWKRPK